MAWVKLEDTFAEDPRWDGPGADGLALHVAALCYANRNLTDGRIGANRVKVLFPVVDLDSTVVALVKAGWWELDPDGIRIADYLDNQPSADTVRAKREESAERQERSRKHRAGEHSMCIEGWYCPQGAVTRDKTRDRHVSHDAPSRTRPDPKGRDEVKARTADDTTGLAPGVAATMRVASQGFTVTVQDDGGDE